MRVLSYTSPHDALHEQCSEITEDSPACPECGARKATHKAVIIHRVRAHGYRDARRGLVTSTICPACLGEHTTIEGAKVHYQKRRCLEAQVEFAAEAMDEGEAQMDAPLHANDGTPFPRALTTMQGKVLDWEIAATVDMVITWIASWGAEGVSLQTTLVKYIRCVIESRLNARQTARHERYLCAVIDGMHQHLLLSGVPVEGSVTDDVLLKLILNQNGSAPWGHVKEVMESTWMEWCCRRMIEIKDDDDGCRPVGDVMLRLCRSLQQPPQPYHERA
jgi:hypothetical protein